MSVAQLVLVSIFLRVPAGVLVNRVAAVVDAQVVTQAELFVEARVALVLREGEAAGELALDAQILASFLDYVVNQLLIAGQARRVGVPDVEAAELDLEASRFVARFATREAYRRFMSDFGISEDNLRLILLRNLRNERFVAERMRLLVRGEGLAASSPEYQQALRRWLAELRLAAEVRLIGASGELETIDARAGEPSLP